VPAGNGNAERKQQDKFIEFLDEHFNDIAGGPDVLICNGSMWLDWRLLVVLYIVRKRAGYLWQRAAGAGIQGRAVRQRRIQIVECWSGYTKQSNLWHQ
jgi:hypothetical protein